MSQFLPPTNYWAERSVFWSATTKAKEQELIISILTLNVEAPPILQDFGGHCMVVGATRKVLVGVRVGEDDA